MGRGRPVPGWVRPKWVGNSLGLGLATGSREAHPSLSHSGERHTLRERLQKDEVWLKGRPRRGYGFGAQGVLAMEEPGW